MSASSRERVLRFLDQPDLALSALLATSALIAAALNLSPVLRIALALPSVLFVPGYTFVNALFPTLVLPTVERILLSLGSSLGLTILLGLALAALRIPLEPLAWASGLALITIVAAVVAWARRARRGLAGPTLSIARMPLPGIVVLGVAVLITADVLLGSRLIAGQQQAPSPAQLWLVPVNGKPNDAILGVRAGDAAEDFRVVISVAGESIYQFDVPLEPLEVWERNVTFASELRDQPIVARLYEGSDPQEIRYVVLQPLTNSG
jgi:hypothetical protein